MPKTPLTDNKNISFSSTPSYTSPAQEDKEQYEPQQSVPVATGDHHAAFDPLRSWEEIQQFLSSFHPPSLTQLQSFIFIPYLFSNRYNPFLPLMFLVAANMHVALAADDNSCPRPEGLLTSSVEDNNLLSSVIDPPPSSAPLATYEVIDGITRRDSSHDSLHEKKHHLVTSPSIPPNPLAKIGEKFGALLLNNKFEEAHNYLIALQRKKSHLQLNDIRDRKGRSLLEIVITSNYSDKKVNLAEYLIKTGCDINAIGSDGRVLLSIAVAMPKPNKKLIELLLNTNGIAVNKRGEGSDTSRRIAIEVIIHRLLDGEDLFELAQILIKADANILFKSSMYDNRDLFSLLHDIDDSEKRTNLKYYIMTNVPLQSIFQALRIYLKDSEYFYALVEKMVTLPTGKISPINIAFFCLAFGLLYFGLYPTYKFCINQRIIAMLEKQLNNLSHFEELFLNSKESLSEAKTLKAWIKKTKTTTSNEIERLNLFRFYESRLQEITISYQELTTPIKDHIKAHHLEKIKKALALFEAKQQTLEQKDSKPTKALLRNKQEDLEKITPLQHQNNQENLENIITTGEQLLNETNALIENYISEEFQKLSSELKSIASKLKPYENLTQLKTDVTTKITELSTPISFPINFDNIEALLMSCKTLISDIQKRIRKQDLAQSRATKNAHEQALQEKRGPLLNTLKSIEAQLKYLDYAQADPIQTTTSEYHQAIFLIDDIDDQLT